MDRENEPMSETAILPLVDVVKKEWKKDNVITFLQRKDLNLDLDDEDIEIIRSKKVSGKDFLGLTEEKLENYGLQPGPASRIAELVKEIKGEQDQPASARKRPRENNFITTEGPLHPHHGSLMLYRNFFHEVESEFLNGQSYVIHGPYQSGKSTFLFYLRIKLMGESSNYAHFSMPQVQGDILKNKRQGFFNFISNALLKKRLSETETFGEINNLSKPLFILIDEFQFIFTDRELLNVAKHFFREISNAMNIHYIAVGTFRLMDLLKDDGELISPFNKASFYQMPLFTTQEMGELFDLYKLNFDEVGVLPDLRTRIIEESCGHPASFMILLKLFYHFRPTLNQWARVLQGNLERYMNGTHRKLKDEIEAMDGNERAYLCELTDYQQDHWSMELSDLTKLKDIDKKLFDIGILYIMDSNKVGFTSCIILRVCIDATFPTPSKRLSRDEVPRDPVDLLVLGLKHIDPRIITDKRAKNVHGPRERAIQASLFSIFNGLLPKPEMMCLMELKSSGKYLLDLMITDGDQNLTAYSLKCDVTSESKLKAAFEQAKVYANYFNMEIYLLDFFPDYHDLCSSPNDIEDIILISVKHNNECTRIKLQSSRDLVKGAVYRNLPAPKIIEELAFFCIFNNEGDYLTIEKKNSHVFG
ncbi:hypothetical protein GLOIN_2v1735228 [Rhizophagus clarus]|uniref:SAM domain-containing protein n=1 Tax=Rhizophagus clarus TaxID=94130 RepID=A0A8H3QWN8_9GLOM|nr:hypothetical protein GLOIN_2v1735228 [Rhizophagus clarus]